MAFHVAYKGKIVGPADDGIIVSWIKARHLDEKAKIAPGPNGPWKTIRSHRSFNLLLAEYELPTDDEMMRGFLKFDNDSITVFALLTIPIICCIGSIVSGFTNMPWIYLMCALMLIFRFVVILTDVKRSGLNTMVFLLLQILCGAGNIYYFGGRQRAQNSIGLVKGVIAEILTLTGMGMASTLFVHEQFASSFYYRAPDATQIITLFISALFWATIGVVIVAFITSFTMKVSWTLHPSEKRKSAWEELQQKESPDVHALSRTSGLAIFTIPLVCAIAFAVSAIWLPIYVPAILFPIVSLVLWNVIDRSHVCPVGTVLPIDSTLRDRLLRANAPIYNKYTCATLSILAIAIVCRIIIEFTAPGATP